MKNKTLLFAIISFVLLCTSLPKMSMAQDNNAQGQKNVFEQFYGQKLESGVKGSQDALLYIDFEREDGKIPEALISLGYNVTTATDWPVFTIELNTGNYDLAVGFNQGFTWDATEKTDLLAAIGAFLAGGGSFVFNDWTEDPDFAALFEVTFTGNTNQTIMHLDASIEDGLPNPITLSNTTPGYLVFSTGLTATGDAEAIASFDNGDDAIVRGNNGRSIILGYLTDTPPEAHRQQLFENLFQEVTSEPEPVTVPFSNWTLYVTFSLIMLFAVFRFRKMA